MNKMVTKVFAVTTGAAMFAGMFAAGIGAPAKQADAYNTSTAAGIANLMSVKWDNATNVQVFKTDYGYGAWATDSNGNIIGGEPVAKTPYYIPTVGTKGRDTDYGDFVAAYEVDLSYTSRWGFTGNTLQTYYDVADFATNITDHYDHFANGLPIFADAYTSSASFDKNGGTTSPYIFGFEFGDYNPNYVEFVGTTWNVKNYNNKDKAYVDNTQIGVWTSDDLAKKYPDFTAGRDALVTHKEGKDTVIDLYVPEVYGNPIFNDANSFANSYGELFGADWADWNPFGNNFYGTDPENILVNAETGYPGQIMKDANGRYRDENNNVLGYDNDGYTIYDFAQDWQKSIDQANQ